MKHEWRAEITNIADHDLTDALEHYEDDGWEIFAIVPRSGDDVLVVMRALNK